MLINRGFKSPYLFLSTMKPKQTFSFFILSATESVQNSRNQAVAESSNITFQSG